MTVGPLGPPPRKTLLGKLLSADGGIGGRRITKDPQTIAVAPRVAAAAESSFTTIGRFLTRVKEGCIGLLPERIASQLDPRRKIVYALLRVPAEEREDVLRHALAIISPSNPAFVETFTENVTAYTNGEGSLSSKILPLITREVFSSHDEHIIRVMAGLNHEEREHLTTCTARMDAERARVIIELIYGAPSIERNSLVAHAFSLITPGMNESMVESLIDEVCGTPFQEREDVMNRTRRLITPGMNGFDIRSLVSKVRNIPVQERGDVIAHACQLITPEMSEFEMENLLDAVRNIPVQERADVVGKACQVITPRMGGHERAGVIDVVRNIPVQERDDVIAHARQLITPERPGQNVIQIIGLINLLPREQRAAFVRNRLNPNQARIQHGTDVHESDRDQRTKEAIGLLRNSQRTVSPSEIDRAYGEFVAYLENSPDSKRKSLAQQALLEPKKADEAFGPLIDDEVIFTIQGVEISGRELIGRLWAFASRLDEKEQKNAKEGMISALENSYDDYGRVCNQGKTQRLIVAALQGRLAEVNIDGIQIKMSEAEAMQRFFSVEAHRLIENLEDLIAAANTFCDENASVDREKFLEQINAYAREQEMEPGPRS